VGTVAFDVETVAFDVETVAFDVETAAFDVETAAFDVETAAFDVETAAFDVETVAFDVETAAFDVETVAFEADTTCGSGALRRVPRVRFGRLASGAARAVRALCVGCRASGAVRRDGDAEREAAFEAGRQSRFAGSAGPKCTSRSASISGEEPRAGGKSEAKRSARAVMVRLGLTERFPGMTLPSQT
jgi:hypothetical protein